MTDAGDTFVRRFIAGKLKGMNDTKCTESLNKVGVKFFKERLKIALILPVSWGGIPHYTAELSNALWRYADVFVLKPKDQNDILFFKTVKVINAFEPLTFSRRFIAKAFSFKNFVNFFSYRNLKLIDYVKPDVVHIQGSYPQLIFLLLWSKMRKNLPMVITLHGVYENFLKALAFHLFTTKKPIFGILVAMGEFIRSLMKFDAVIVHTKKDKDALIKGRVRPEKIHIIPHGAFSFLKEYAKSKIIVEEENTLLFFGYITHGKGLEYLMKSIPIVSKEIPDVKLIIAGEGDFSNYCKCIDWGLYKSKFEIYNEFIPNEKVPELFMRASLVILPYTDHATASGVLTIALSFGKPVVATNVGEIPTLCSDCGLIVPSKNVKALATAIIRLLKDKELRKKMSANALKKAEELSWDNVAKMHIQVYEGLR